MYSVLYNQLEMSNSVMAKGKRIGKRGSNIDIILECKQI